MDGQTGFDLFMTGFPRSRGGGLSVPSVPEVKASNIVSAPGLGTKRGSLATEICVNIGDIAPKPASIDFEHAAAMGVAALTVGGAFRHIGVGEGDTVVISAASGGIGSVAVQYAVARGARVIGIAGAANAEFIRSLGGPCRLLMAREWGNECSRRPRVA